MHLVARETLPEPNSQGNHAALFLLSALSSLFTRSLPRSSLHFVQKWPAYMCVILGLWEHFISFNVLVHQNKNVVMGELNQKSSYPCNAWCLTFYGQSQNCKNVRDLGITHNVYATHLKSPAASCEFVDLIICKSLVEPFLIMHDDLMCSVNKNRL